MARDYIPTNPEARNLWSENLYAATLANATAWGIPADKMTEFTDQRTLYTPLYAAFSVKRTRTPEQSENYQNFMRTSYIPFLREFVQGFVVNNSLIPMGTRTGLGLNPRGVNPRKAKPAITVIPIIDVKPLGGGKVAFSFNPSGNKRAGILNEADGVLLYTRVVTPDRANGMALNNGPVEVETDPLELVGYDSQFSTKARLTQQFTRDKVGSFLEVYARWANSSNPEKNGPFTTMVKVVIA